MSPADDPRVSRVLGTSALLGAADRLIETVWRAAGHSRVASLFGRWRRDSLRLASAERSTAVGIALLVASASHLVMQAAHEMPAGWLWLVPPGMAATIGVTLVVWPRNGGAA